MIVVDANVAIKWFLREPGSDAALELLSGVEQLVAPDLIEIEVPGALTRSFRQGYITEAIARERCSAWADRLSDGAITLLSSQSLLSEATTLSLEIRHSLQDCLYLAAAKHLGADLITADRPFWKRIHKLHPETRLLAGLLSN